VAGIAFEREEGMSGRLCVVSCGLAGDDCACFRAQMQAVFADLLAKQEPLGAEFERALADNREELYEA